MDVNRERNLGSQNYQVCLVMLGTWDLYDSVCDLFFFSSWDLDFAYFGIFIILFEETKTRLKAA